MVHESHGRHNYQKWINIGILFLLMFVGLGFCSSNKSLYLSAITEALDIKRSVFSLATSCRFITTAIINVFFGRFVAKFGTKKLMIAGVVSLMFSMLANSLANSMPLFFVAEILSGIGFSWAGTTIVGCVVNRWVDENRGTITGAVLCANGVGGAVSAQIVSPLIYDENNIFGYRNAYRLVIIILAVLLVLIAVLFREKRQDVPALKSSAPQKKKRRGRSWVGITFSEAAHKPYFYGAAVCIALTGMILQGVTGISAAHMRDSGLDTAFVASMVSLQLLFLTGSKFLSGFLYDRFGLRVTISICSTAAVLTMFTLAFVSAALGGQVLALAYTAFAAIALPLETVMLPLYAGDLFGDRDYDKIMGMFVSFNVAGYALGAPIVNLGFDIAGSYTPILVILGFLMLAVIVALQFVISAAHRVQRKVMNNSADVTDTDA